MKVFIFLFILFSMTMFADEEIKLIHSKVSKWNGSYPLIIQTNVVNSHKVNYIILNYKTSVIKDWSQLELLPKGGVYSAEIPVEELSKDGAYYYLEVVDIYEKSINGFASKENPQFVKIEMMETFVETKKDTEDVKNDNKFIEDELAIFIDTTTVKVKLASGKEELLLDSPLSTTVITYDEIKKSGATSIQEALRLVPGMIVREQTAGNYDIHIRGFDSIPPNSMLPFSANSITLLMIDNRVIYNYLNGGIFWEALPIDINDVDRIEIVRGPSSAMYGPNAAAGVINIITKRASKKTQSFSKVNLVYGDGNIQTDRGNAIFVNGIAGYQKDKIAITLSGNMQERNRFSTPYWSWTNGEEGENGAWVDNPGEIKSIDDNLQTFDELDYTKIMYPHPEISVRKKGFNGFVNYELTKNVIFDVAMGGQSSEVQKPFVETLANFILGTTSDTQYIDFKSYLYDATIRVSYLWGSQDSNNYPSFSNDIDVLTTNLEYDYKYKSLNIRPIFSYNKIQYLGKGFGGEERKEAVMENVAFSLRTEYTLFEKLRLIAAGRVDKFAHNDDYLLTYQLATTFKLTDKGIVRAVYSRANRNTFMANAFMFVRNLEEERPLVYIGNTDLKPMTMDMAEIGIRVNPVKQFGFDVEMFYTKAKDYDDLAFTGETVMVGNVARAKLTFQNLKLIAKQYGITTSFNFTSRIFQGKLFGTLQKTDLENHNENFLMNPTSDDLKDLEHVYTPKFYGGAYLNFNFIKNLNININPYFYTSQTYKHTNGTYEINSKLILNGMISYDVTEKLMVYFDARNALNNKDKEFGFSDDIGGLYMLGLRVEY